MSNKKESLIIENASKKYNDIPDRTEKMFRVFLERVFPEADISHEAEPFTTTNIDGTRETTIPDYRVIKPCGKKIYIEITKDKKNGTDPKERDRRIMKLEAPNFPYVVLYSKTLKYIQRKYEGFDFFKEEKKRKIDKEPSPEEKPRCIKVNLTAPIKSPALNTYRTR